MHYVSGPQNIYVFNTLFLPTFAYFYSFVAHYYLSHNLYYLTMRINKTLILWAAFLLPLWCFAQTCTISGTWKDKNQKPVSGATITIKSIGQTATTDANGN